MSRSILTFVLVAFSAATLPAAEKDIVDTAVSAGSFKTLVAAVKAAGLVDTLKGKGPFTVFAPTDEAFAKLPKSAIADLLKPENKAQLQAILTYHVVPGKVMAGDLLNVGEAKSVQGSPVKFSLSVENAKIIKTDIACSNGVIHVIDSVIMPPKKAVKAAAIPRKMIQQVVAKGSQLYNTGNHCQCADLYTKTMTHLTKMKGLDVATREKIDHTLQVASTSPDSSKRAWVLRQGLDSVYHQAAH